MAKKKNTKAVEPVEEIKIDEVEEVEEAVEEVKEECDEKECLDSLKEKICEFYGIRDEELFSKDCDLSKYNLKKQEEATLLEWVEANKKVKSGDVVFDIYTTNTEAGAIIEKYGISPKDVAEGNLGELTAEEKEIITAHYNDLIEKL